MPIATLLRNITCRNCGKSNTKLSISNSKEIKDLKESICDEIKEKLPVLVKDALIKTSKRTGFFTKTFAEVVKQQNETVIKNAVKSTSGAAFKEGMMTMGKNMEERQKRLKNLILSGIVENDITAETNSKMTSHLGLLQCSPSTCNRQRFKTTSKNSKSSCTFCI